MWGAFSCGSNFRKRIGRCAAMEWVSGSMNCWIIEDGWTKTQQHYFRASNMYSTIMVLAQKRAELKSGKKKKKSQWVNVIVMYAQKIYFKGNLTQREDDDLWSGGDRHCMYLSDALSFAVAIHLECWRFWTRNSTSVFVFLNSRYVLWGSEYPIFFHLIYNF